MQKVPLAMLAAKVAVGMSLSGSVITTNYSDGTSSTINLATLIASGGGGGGTEVTVIESDSTLTLQSVLLVKKLPKLPYGDTSYFSSVITLLGSLKSWGSGARGQLGQGESSDTNVPKYVTFYGGPPSTPIAEVHMGGHNLVALTESGAVYVCGENGNGQLGQGHTTDVGIMLQVGMPGGTPAIVDVSVSGVPRDTVNTSDVVNRCSIFYIDNAGFVYATGSNSQGQLGDGTTNNMLTATRVWNGAPAKKVFSYLPTTYLLLQNGTLYATGDNSNGQLGINSLTDNHGWIQCKKADGTPITGVDDIFACNVNGSSNAYTAFALINDGSLYACGGNRAGQLGNGGTTSNKLFTNIPTFNSDPITSFDTGGDMCIAATASGKVYTWGENASYSCGVSPQSNADVKTPYHVNTYEWGAGAPWAGKVLKVMISKGTNARTAYILCTDGQLYSCGQNSNGQAGAQVSGNYYKQFHRMDNIVLRPDEKIVDIVSLGFAGSAHLLALTNFSRGIGIGYNNKGQTGVSTNNANVFGFGDIRM
jgi:alpha-tubulin suppressor-like RCC1 family protein